MTHSNQRHDSKRGLTLQRNEYKDMGAAKRNWVLASGTTPSSLNGNLGLLGGEVSPRHSGSGARFDEQRVELSAIDATDDVAIVKMVPRISRSRTHRPYRRLGGGELHQPDGGRNLDHEPECGLSSDHVDACSPCACHIHAKFDPCSMPGLNSTDPMLAWSVRALGRNLTDEGVLSCRHGKQLLQPSPPILITYGIDLGYKF